MKIELSVVAPCFNEAGNLPELVTRLLRALERKSILGELILVNDGSHDNTGQVVDELASTYPSQVMGLHHQSNRGIEAAWVTGMSRASGRYVCFIDSDLQYQPEDVPRLYREIIYTHADVVQGYRSSIGRLQDARYVLSKGLNAILNTAFTMRLRDNKSGFVIARRDTMADILRHRYRYKYFQSFITVAASRKGYSVRETETLFESRLVGRSFIPKFPLRMVSWVFVDTVKAVVEFRLRHKQDNILSEFLEKTGVVARSRPLEPWRNRLLNAYCATMPTHAWMLTGRVRHYYDELERSQWLGASQIRELQNAKLRRLIHQAYYHVPYYRELMQRVGVRPDDIKDVEDLKKMPLLDKQAVRENVYFDLLSDNHDKKKILKISTSGSTGEPFFCYADQHQLELRWAATLRSMHWTGYRFGDRQARLWHQTIGMSKSQVLRERIDAAMSRRMFVPAYEMSEKNVGKVLERLRRYRPVLLDGYAESFNMLAQFVKQEAMDGFCLKGIISSAQVLPEKSRDAIEKAFGCRVFDKYGSREFSGIAYECEAHAGHHVVAESYVVEILREGREAAPGEMGEVVITDLNNLTMPLIRYRIGDLAVAMGDQQSCTCGRGLPRIGRIEGRIQAIIFTRAGRMLPGTFFAHFFKDYDHIVRRYQVVQEVYGEIELRIIKGTRFTDVGFEALMQTLRSIIGWDTPINLAFVNDIPLVHTGKHQGSISRLAIDFQGAVPVVKAVNS